MHLIDQAQEVVKLFSFSTKVSMKFKLLINLEIAQINGNFRFKSPKQALILLIDTVQPVGN